MSTKSSTSDEARQSDSAQAGALSGITVVDISTVVMGPMATQILGDMGADDIRIEPPFDTARFSPAGLGRTEGMGPLYLQVNRNKRSVMLDLKSEDGKTALMELLATADVLVTNMRGKALDRLGIGYEQIRDRFPELIYAHAQGFNKKSSQSARPAYDEVIQAVTGLVDMQDRASGSLQFMPTFIADKTASLYLLNGVLAALFARERTGKGQEVALAMADAMIAVNMIEHMAGDVYVPREGDVGNPLSFSEVHAAMRTKDGKAIAAVPYTYRDVRKLLIGAGLTEKAADPVWDEPVLNRDVFTEGVETVLANSASKTAQEWEEYLVANDMPYGVVVGIDEIPDSDYVRELNLVTEVDHPTEGRIRVLANPLQFSQTPVSVRRQAELPGQSTDDVLAALRDPASV